MRGYAIVSVALSGGESNLDDKQFARLIRDLEVLRKLPILHALQSGASQPDGAKLLGLSDRQIRNILSGKA